MYIKSGLASTVGQLLAEALEDVRSLQNSSEFEIDMWFLWRDASNNYKGGRNTPGAAVNTVDLLWATMYRRCGVDLSGWWLDSMRDHPEENLHLVRPMSALSSLVHNDVNSAVSIFYGFEKKFKQYAGSHVPGEHVKRLPLEEHLAILEKSRDWLLEKGL